MKNKNLLKQSGFTLIELLVVIAIIALLATIALASLNSARTKSAVSAAKGNMANLAAAAETYYDNGHLYYGISAGAEASDCNSGVFGDPVVHNMIMQAVASSASGAVPTCYTGPATGSTNIPGQFWAVSIDKMRDGSGSYCVDNSGIKASLKNAQITGKCG